MGCPGKGGKPGNMRVGQRGSRDPKFISEPSAHCHFKDPPIVKDVVLDLSWEHEF